MDKTIEEYLEKYLDMKTISRYHFKTLYGFTFVFKSRITFINDSISSASMNPQGIIFKENDEFYFTPLDKTYEINEIIKEYLKREII